MAAGVQTDRRVGPGTRRTPDRRIAWFLILVGVAIVSLWSLLLAAGEVAEIERGDVAIWFHLVAELLTAGLLVLGGIGMLASRAWAAPVAAMAIGALLYTAIASAGFYAAAGEWGVVVMFAALGSATVVVAARVIRSRGDGHLSATS